MKWKDEWMKQMDEMDGRMGWIRWMNGYDGWLDVIDGRMDEWMDGPGCCIISQRAEAKGLCILK